MKLKVKYIKFHGGDAHVPGLGQLGTHLPNESRSWKVDMYVDSSVHPNLLFLTIDGKPGAIPLSAIQNIMLEELPRENLFVKSSTGVK